MQKLFILDYDNTVANPKSSPSDEIMSLFITLLKNNKVAILTAGRSIKRLKELIILNTELNESYLLKNLYLCPKYGNTIFAWENNWYVVYEAPDIKSDEYKLIKEAVRRVNWNKYIEKNISKQKIHDKGPVLSVNCLGNNATDEEKSNWDKDREIRKAIKEELIIVLKTRYEIFITGRNTIDIMPKGRNKANNILKLLEVSSINKDNSLYIGDEFYPEGNDYPILSLNMKTHQVNNPEETELVLRSYI